MKNNKRIKSLIATVLVLIICFSFNANAEEKEQFKSVDVDEKQFLATNVSYSSAFEQALVSAIANFESKIDVSKYNIKSSKIGLILYDISNKYPEYFYYDMGETYYSVTSFNTIETLLINYYYSKTECQNMVAQVERAIKKPLSQMKKLNSDEEKFLFAHDYIATHNSYDEDGLSGNVNLVDDNSFTAYGCLVLNKSVCQGMSDAFILLCKKAGLTAYFVSSDPLCHAWNLVKIGDEYYHLDITWDSNSSEAGFNFLDLNGFVSHSYFLKSDDEFINLEHSNSGRVDWDATFQANDSEKYNNYYWKNVNSCIFPIGDYLYYVKDGELIKQHRENGNKQTVYTVPSGNDNWYSDYALLAYDYNTNYLFINEYDGIYAFDTKTNDVFKVFENNENDLILGIAFYGDELKYDVSNGVKKPVTKTAKIVFPQEKIVLGDINNSGEFDLSDILDLKLALADSFEGLNKYFADMNADGEINTIDLLLMRKQYVE